MKKTLFTIFQCAVTIAIIVWLLSDPRRRAEMGTAISHADIRWLLLGLVVYGIVECCGALRWFLYLRVQSIGISFPRTTALFFIGMFFNSFLPGSTGGDLIKIYYLMKETRGRGAAAFLSVVMDRVIGVMAMALIALVLIVWRWEWLMQVPSTAALVHYLIAFLALMMLALAGSFVINSFGWEDRLPAKMPLRVKILELSSAYTIYGKAWRVSIAAFLLSIPAHLGYFFTFYCTARALRADVALLDVFAIMPVIATASALPISMAGVGVRETLFQELLGKLASVPEGTAVLVGTLGFALIFLWSLIGGAVYPFYRPSQHATLHDMEESVGAIEDKIANGEA